MKVVPTPDRIAALQSDWLRAASASDKDAKAAATKALRGVVKSASAILANLEALSYPKVPGIRPPTPGLTERLRDLERCVGGPPPPALALFWKTVGALSFIDLRRYAHVGFWKESGMVGGGDGVHLDGCDAKWLKFTRVDFRELSDDPDMPPPSRYPLSLSPDIDHKDDISGGAAYEMKVGGGWLAPLENFAWPRKRRPISAPKGACDLVSYLRTALLECGGFPGFYGARGFEPVRVKLLEGVPLF